MLVLKALAALLKLVRATLMRFSVPSNWACSSRKFWFAFSSGYLSLTASSLPRAEVTAPCAFWYSASFSGVRLAASTVICVAWLRACITPSSVSFSCEAYPLTVLTRFGIRSARRWYCVSTLDHCPFTFSSILTKRLYPVTPQMTRRATATKIMIVDFFILFSIY